MSACHSTLNNQSIIIYNIIHNLLHSNNMKRIKYRVGKLKGK